ncbi:DNA primase family protein [Virgibacillus sp. L01]|uniref:DNA primase family protein n=1 Tax=Virgibacillus sp. L01 TaxID=3457429 RepID=UPI003FCEFFE4
MENANVYNQISEYISPYKATRIKLLDSSNCTIRLLESIKLPDSLSMLVTALQMVVSRDVIHYFSSLLKQYNQTPMNKATDLYKSAGSFSEAIVSDDLIKELSLMKQVGDSEERGFIYDEKKDSYLFNANAFANHFLRRCSVRSTKEGRLFIYNQSGFYDEPSEVELGKIVRTLMHEGRYNSWKSKLEGEAIKAIQREAVTVDEMNTHRNYINLKTGMLSLDTFKLFQHHPDYLSTVQIPVEYDSQADCPLFKKFMNEITVEDTKLMQVHQEIMGYFLTAETKAEKAFYYFGGGANGKSVLASIITSLVGSENISSIPLANFGEQFGLESLINKTVNIASENETGGKPLRTENFKAIVSGDPIRINIKYRTPIHYKPFTKLLFLVNNLPDSMDVTHGYFRKLMVIPFNRTFHLDERNVNLIEELSGELPGILNLAIEGLKRLRRNQYQFSSCETIEQFHQSYYTEQNPVAEFFEEHIKLDGNSRTKQSEFHKKYLYWLGLQGIDDKGTKSKQVFWKNLDVVLKNYGVEKAKKKVRGIIHIDGITIMGLDDEPNRNSIEF